MLGIRGRNLELDRFSYKIGPLLRFIVESKGKHNDSNCPIEKNIYFHLLQHLWAKIPNILKYHVCLGCSDVLFINFDIPTLSLIFSDEEIQCFGREGRSDIAYFRCMELMTTRESFEQLDILIDLLRQLDMLHSNDVKKKFKQSYVRTLESLIRNENFEVADNFLNWISDSPTQRSKMKSKINSIRICLNVTKTARY